LKAIEKLPSSKEMTYMKPRIAIAVAAATLLMTFSSASAQTKATANIPFNFRVGSALMPAGAYDIESPDSRVLWLRNRNGHDTAVAVAMTTAGSTTPPVKLVFNRYGDRYFLSETLTANGESDKKFSPSKLEKSIRTEASSLNTQGRSLIALK
jgi:hypothetical protein